MSFRLHAICAPALIAASSLPALGQEASTAAAAPLLEPEIIVIGERHRLEEIPGSAVIIDAEVLEDARVYTINEAMRKVPGVFARDEEGFGLRPNLGIRGLNPTRSTKVLLLEDGLPLTYAPYGDNASYYHPPVERFDRIELLKGSGQILFGPHTVGGVINYITPSPPADFGGQLVLQGGSRGYLEAHTALGDTLQRTGYLLNATRKETDGARDNMHFEVSDLNLKVVRQLARHQGITVRASYYDEDSKVPYSGLTLAEYEADPRANPFVNDRFAVSRWATSATHRIDWSDAFTLSTSAYYTRFDRDWWRQSSNSNQRPNDASDPACGGMANLLTTCGNEGRLRQYWTAGLDSRAHLSHGLFGIASEAEFGLRFHREDQWRVQANSDTPTGRGTGTGPNAGLIEDSSREVDAVSVFVQNRFALGDWTLTPGVRLESVDYLRVNDITGERGRADVAETIPGLGVTWAITGGTTLFAGAHRGFSPPNVADVISASGGTVDLDPELSWNYELGVRSALGAGLDLELTAFRMDFENQVISESLAGGAGATLTNAGETLHQGLEALLAFRSRPLFDGSYRVFARTAYTWLADAQFRGTRYSSIDPAVSVTGHRLPYAPKHLLSMTLGLDNGAGLTVQVEGVYNASMYTDDINTVAVSANGQQGRIDAYTIWNAAANYELPSGRWAVFLAAKNAFDELYVVDMTRGLIPGLPRIINGGFSFRF
jgi:Fe(3+) dicitrate transport protein